MKNNTVRNVWVVIAVVVGSILYTVIFNNPHENGAQAAEVESTPPAAKAVEKEQTLWDAYGMACDIVRRGLQWPESTKCEISKDECVAYGDNRWLIVAYLKWDGLRKRFTAEIKYDPSTKLWGLTYEPAIKDIR